MKPCSAISLIFIYTLLLHSCGFSPTSLQNSKTAQYLTNSPIVASSAKLIAGEGFGDKYFYYPNSDSPLTPASLKLSYTDIHIPSTGHTSLHGWFLPAKNGVKKSIGTVVYHHGNEGSVGLYLTRVPWLVEANFNVIMYDYRGYGKSTGTVTRRGLIDDAAAAIRYALQRDDLKHTKLISYGYSLGGAKSTVAHAESKFGPRLVAAVNEASFASYKDMAEIKGGLTAKRLTKDDYSPVNYLKRTDLPVFLIHGTHDSIVPISQATKLKASSPHKKNIYYWKIQGATHFTTLTHHHNATRKRLLTALQALLK